MPEAACAESSDLSIAFLSGSGYNQTIDSNGAVGHLLTRSAVFVKMLSYFWVRHCGRPECRRKGKKNKIKLGVGFMAANVMEIYGSKVFNEHVMKERLPSATYKSLKNTIN